MRNQLDTDRSGKVSFEEYAFRFGRKLQVQRQRYRAIFLAPCKSCDLHGRWTSPAAAEGARSLQRRSPPSRAAAHWPRRRRRRTPQATGRRTSRTQRAGARDGPAGGPRRPAAAARAGRAGRWWWRPSPPPWSSSSSPPSWPRGPTPRPAACSTGRGELPGSAPRPPPPPPSGLRPWGGVDAACAMFLLRPRLRPGPGPAPARCYDAPLRGRRPRGAGRRGSVVMCSASCALRTRRPQTKGTRIGGTRPGGRG